MKFTKTFAIIFLTTFFIGYVSVLPTKKSLDPNKLELVNSQTFPDFSNNSATPKVESKFKPEIFDVPDFSQEPIPKYKIELLEVGDGHRKEDVQAKSGETWLGLYKGKNNYFLRSKKIKVYPTNKPDFGKDSISIEIGSKSEPIVLIKNAKRLRDGKVETLFSRPSSERSANPKDDDSLLTRNFVKEFKLGERKYTLRVKQAVNYENDKFLALVLETENKSQIIEYCPYFEEDAEKFQYEEYLANLIWVGDLDHDGKLDLYLEYNTHEKGYLTILFLSSEAEKGKLLKDVAWFSPTGC